MQGSTNTRIILLSTLLVVASCQAAFLQKRSKTILEVERVHESKTLDDEDRVLELDDDIHGSLLVPKTALKEEKKEETQELEKEIKADKKDDAAAKALDGLHVAVDKLDARAEELTKEAAKDGATDEAKKAAVQAKTDVEEADTQAEAIEAKAEEQNKEQVETEDVEAKALADGTDNEEQNDDAEDEEQPEEEDDAEGKKLLAKWSVFLNEHNNKTDQNTPAFQNLALIATNEQAEKVKEEDEEQDDDAYVKKRVAGMSQSVRILYARADQLSKEAKKAGASDEDDRAADEAFEEFKGAVSQELRDKDDKDKVLTAVRAVAPKAS